MDTTERRRADAVVVGDLVKRGVFGFQEVKALTERFGDLTLREVKNMLRKAPATNAAALLAQVLRYVGMA